MNDGLRKNDELSIYRGSPDALGTAGGTPALPKDSMPIAAAETVALDLTRVRSQFPSLSQTVAGQPAVFLDGPGGTQVPQRVIDAISDYLKNSNANTCGAYATSRRTDAVIADARAAMADFFGCDQDEVVFGPNMTTLTFALSRSSAANSVRAMKFCSLTSIMTPTSHPGARSRSAA